MPARWSMEMSVGRDRLIVNCGAFPAGPPEWRDATRATAAHSTLVIADVNSSELKPDGLGRRPVAVEAQRQEANGAHWLEASHDGWVKPFGAVHRRRLYRRRKRRGRARRGRGGSADAAAVYLALPSPSHRAGERAAGWRGGAAAPALGRRLAAARRRSAHDAGRKHLSWRPRAAPGRAGGADRLRRRRRSR